MDNQEKNLNPGNLGGTKTRGELFRQGGLVLGILILLLGTGGFLKSLGAWQAGYYVSSQFASSMENILMYSVQLLDTDLIYDKETQEYILPKEVLTKSPGLQSQLKSELENLQEEIHALKQMDFEGYPEKEAKEQRFKVAKELEELEKQALNLEGEFLKKLEEEAKAELNAATEGLNQFQNAMILVDKPDNNITFVNKLYKGEDIESLNTVYYFSLDNKLNSHITYNKYLSPVVGGAKTAMADVGGDYNIIVAFENSPQFYEYHDNINYNYNTFKRDTLMGITTSGMIMICAGVVVLALYRRKGDAIIHTLGGEKSQKAIQNLLLLLSKIKFEFKLVAFLIVLSGIKALPEQIFYDQISWRNITYWIILILVGILLLLDFAQTKNKEEYAKNSYLYNMRNKKTTRGPRGPMASVADGLQKHFDRIFIAGGLIILSFLLAISEGTMDIFIFSAIAGGIFILYQVYQMRTKLYDQRLVYLDQIAAATQEIVNGNMSVMVPEAENLPMGELAKNINKMKEGYGTAMEDQIKSERMKTELITNVSHDLKTPLTSIMNYVDLLKKEEILPEYARDYVTILDQKSQRLNALIQDLFEVSRAASGDMEIKRERLNVGELLNQTLAELNSKIQDSGLNFVVDIPMEPAFAMGDGNKLHRVFENLIVNIIKYSMDHSRVYIELIPGTKTKISMKNIANYPMNFSQEDVVQRFVRGDQSRSTEGSGLGLAITQSFVDLMDMKMKITTDGDLFKVEIEMDSVK